MVVRQSIFPDKSISIRAYQARRYIAVKPISEIKHTSILFAVNSVHNADAASGLTRDLAFNTRHLGINLADGGPGIRLWTLVLLIFLLFGRDQYGSREILTLIDAIIQMYNYNIPSGLYFVYAQNHVCRRCAAMVCTEHTLAKSHRYLPTWRHLLGC